MERCLPEGLEHDPDVDRHEFWRGEAEYYAAVKGGAEGLAMQSMAKDLGIDLKIRVHTDSSACRGICGRTGIGKVRHMAVPLLWL